MEKTDKKIKNHSKSPLNLVDKENLAEINEILVTTSQDPFHLISNPNEILNRIEEKKRIKKRSIASIIRKIDKYYMDSIEEIPSIENIALEQAFMEERGVLGEEYWFCPEEFYYSKVMKLVNENDIIFDIGAGDLRFDLKLSQKVKKVYAIEINPLIIAEPLKIIGLSLPKNLVVIIGNGFEMPIPNDTTTILSLMIKRKHQFTQEMKKYRIISAQHNGLRVIKP